MKCAIYYYAFLLSLLFGLSASMELPDLRRPFEVLRQYEPYSLPESMLRVDQVTEEFITQRLDNFDPQNNQTFQMVTLACPIRWTAMKIE